MSSLFADTHNVVTILEKSDAAEGFEQIIDFLSRSYIHYALTVNPHIYISCIKQFWNTASVKRSGNVTRLQALVDKKNIVISEVVIHEILQLDDAKGIVCLPNKDIFAGLAQIRYEKPSTKLTFYKAFFSSQWKFLIHTILQSLSAKRTSWNEFSTAMASAVICLSKEAQVQVDDVVAAAVEENVAEDVAHDTIPSPLSHAIPSPSQEPSSPPQQPQSSPQAPPQEVGNYQAEGKGQEERMIDDMDIDEGIELVKDADIAESEGRNVAEHAKKQAEIYNLDLDRTSKILSMQEDDSKVQEVVEVVTTAKLITEVVTAAASQVSAASITIPAASETIPAAKPSIPAAAPTVVVAYTRRRKGVVIRDPEEELSSKTPAETLKVKDKGKGIMVETLKLIKKKDQIELDAEYARKLHEEINRDEFNKDIDWNATMDHVNQKSNNPQYIKRYQGMKKRPQTKTRFDENMRFLFKSREEMEEEDQEIIKSINETHAQKAAKRRKLSEEAHEAKDLRKRLEVVEDEDDYVFVEATPLASKTMFKEPDGQDAIWRNQKSVHGLALVKRWKLLTLCGVHVITLSTVQLFLLVERRYPLLRFTLEQLVNVTRLQVEKESEMSLALLEFTR
nr:hypothetical protein [Tanacetum cinerariifolium]